MLMRNLSKNIVNDFKLILKSFDKDVSPRLKEFKRK